MPLYTANGGPLLTAAQVADLLVTPVVSAAVAATVSRVVMTESRSFRIPRVTADPTVAWVNEGDEIAVSDPTLDELTVTPSKLAGLVIVSRELAHDSDPAAAETVGAGLARDIARKVDAAYFGALAAPAQSGLGALAGVSTVDAPVEWENGDPFLSAVAAAEVVGARIDHFVANPGDATALASLKDETGSNRPLLGAPLPPSEGRLDLAGVPLLVSPAVTVGTIWGVPADRSYVVIREDAEVLADDSVFFTSDRTAVRAVMRLGFGFPHPAAVVKIVRAAAAPAV